MKWTQQTLYTLYAYSLFCFVEEKLKATADKLEFNEQNREDNSAETQQLTRVNKQLEAEKNDLLTVLNRKDREIGRLNGKFAALIKRYSSLSLIWPAVCYTCTI